MTDATSNATSIPPRIAALPFAYTAPLALIAAGALLVYWGPLALATPWSAPTLTLTHVVTLGFLTMIGVGLFAPIVVLTGAGTLPWHRATHLVYYGLVLGVVSLAWGTARLEAGPVFLAIAALGVMGVVFLVHGVLALRRARSRGPTVDGLGLTLWSFFVAASFGIWLAHGHGGMEFPGPRPLWLQVHLTVAMLGWIGGVLAALTWEVLPARTGGLAAPERSARRLGQAIAIGVTLAAGVPLAQYFGALESDNRWLTALAAGLTAPAAVAVWIVHPVMSYRAVAGSVDPGAARFWRAGLACAPLSLGIALAAVSGGAPRLGMLFGWLAIFGWAASCFYALAITVMPYALAPLRSVGAAGGDRRLLGLGFGLHAAALVVGTAAIFTLGASLAQLAGLLVALDGIVLGIVVVRRCGPTADLDEASR